MGQDRTFVGLDVHAWTAGHRVLPAARAHPFAFAGGGQKEAPSSWRNVDHVEIATVEWVDWFNHRRLYEYCGDIPPAEMEGAHYAQTRAQELAELSNR